MIKKRPEPEIGIVTPNGNTFATATQILKWKENSDKYNSLMQANSEVVQHNINITKEHQMVERLKNRIEELDEYIQDQFDNHNNIAGIEEDQLSELQKILGEKPEMLGLNGWVVDEKLKGKMRR